MEDLPTRFYSTISSYWRRRKYDKLDGSTTSSKKTMRVAKFGDSRSSGRRFMKLRRAIRVRVRILSPFRLLARLRDAYIDSMIGLATRGSGMSAPARPEALLARRMSKSRPDRLRQEEFEQRILLEIYKSYMEPRRY